MRRLFILLMIVLLPLRGWACGLMSVQMTGGGLAAAVVGAMPADCPMLSMNVDEDDVSQAPAGAAGCASCDLCLPMAEPARLHVGVIAFAAHTVPSIDGVDFCSAESVLAFKPPIS